MLGEAENRTEPQLTTRECEELDVWSAEVGWQTDYRQMGKGKFDAWFNMGLCSELAVVDQYCNREMSATGIPPANCVPLLITQNHGARGVVRGKPLKPNEVFIVGPGSEVTYRTPPDLRMLTLHLPLPRLRRGFEAILGEEPDALIGKTQFIELPEELSRRLSLIGQSVLDAARRSVIDEVASVWQRELEEHFVTALISGLRGPGEREPGRLARQNRVEYVTAARDYIETHLDTPLGLETLARETEVSPRTLEYAFREVFDITPLRYIKVRRLHAARRRLLEAEDPQLTVTRVALNYGFNHFSYFARDYRALFGEYPSESLGAAHRRLGAARRLAET